MFVAGGLDAFNHPEGKAEKADAVTAPFASALGVPDDTVALVRANGAVQMVGGAHLGTGHFPRLAALVLAGSLVPTTLAGHRFWEATDEKERAMQRVQFMKNMAMLGGLLLVVTERPSLCRAS